MMNNYKTEPLKAKPIKLPKASRQKSMNFTIAPPKARKVSMPVKFGKI